MAKSVDPEVKVDREKIVAAARQALAEERQQRAIDCGKEVNEILKKYNCDLIAVPMIKEGRIVAQAQVVAKE
jgi:hypothetical protein